MNLVEQVSKDLMSTRPVTEVLPIYVRTDWGGQESSNRFEIVCDVEHVDIVTVELERVLCVLHTHS